MNKLRIVLLITVLVLSMIAFTGLIMPVQAETEAVVGLGSHRVECVYYKAYIHNDGDTVGAGEWYFRLKYDLPEKNKVTSDAYYKRDGSGWCDFQNRRGVWTVSGDDPRIHFACEAREHDPWGWDSEASSLVWEWINWPWPEVNRWHYRSQRGHWFPWPDFATQYYRFYIRNLAPTVGSISGPSSGEPGVPYIFSVIGSDPEGDSIIYEWSVSRDGGNYVLQGATDRSMRYVFPIDGTYTVRVRAIDIFSTRSSFSFKTVTIETPPTITIKRLRTDRKIYRVGQNIVIDAWIREDGSPLFGGTVHAIIQAKGVEGKPDMYIDALDMTLVNPASGKWRATYGPIPWPANPLGFEGTYRIYVYATSGGASATRYVDCFVAYRHTQSTVAKFLKGISPSRVGVGTNFDVKARIKNPSGSSQTLRVRLILPNGMTGVSGALTRTITLAPGAARTLRWTLKSNTATDKLVKINVLEGGTIRAKLHWYIRDPPDTT